jgi:hypothetical protein
MASNQNQGYQQIDLSDCKRLQQSIAGCIETIEANHQKPQKIKFSKADRLNDVMAKLSAVNDFIKRIGDDNFILESSTPFGLHLIMGECIEELEEIGGLNE